MLGYVIIIKLWVVKSANKTLSMNGNLCNSTCNIEKYSTTVSKLFTRAKKGEKLSLFSVRTIYI